jgi:hypothetical protein
MPPRQFSRFALSAVVPSNVDERKLILTERVPYRFRVLPDTIEHPVTDGDTLYTIASRYYVALDRPAGLYWVIADFQPDPIHDPTLAIDRAVIYVPSLNVVLTEVFNERRREP